MNKNEGHVLRVALLLTERIVRSSFLPYARQFCRDLGNDFSEMAKKLLNLLKRIEFVNLKISRKLSVGEGERPLSIVKFVEGTLQSCYSRDYYIEGDVMLGIPEFDQAVKGFRVCYRCAVDPTFECLFLPLE